MLEITAPQGSDRFAELSVAAKFLAGAIQARCDSLKHFGQSAVGPQRNVENVLVIELSHGLVAEEMTLMQGDCHPMKSRCIARERLQLRLLQ